MKILIIIFITFRAYIYISAGDTALLRMHPKKKSKTVVLTQTTEEYASRSSIHGIGYAFDRELSTFDRVLWLLVVLVFLAVAAALTMNLWTQWRNEQVMRFLLY